MLFLAIDTSGRQGGVTLARCIKELKIIESVPVQGGTFSAELIPQIAELLNKHGYSVQQLQGLVAVTGPGSFTGLRIGLTAVKGLAEVLHIPIAAVSALEVLLAAVYAQEDTMAVLDAGRGEVYAGIQNSGKREEFLLSATEAAVIAQSRNLRVFAADANTAAKLGHARVITYCSSEIAARIGFGKLEAKDTVDVLALDANYIRKSEAEYMQKIKKSDSL
ncbi:MAG TPA: tRNA (adenosine(37)-N6)-threonylcarbamoyltransferase complex dimerization subunit type 1 TsaB [Terriglobales bacterium]|nr:tRNA (adenosine(37)-N6)-threonylcarbamoyltransferase complex dimerization subunit type 1 TsaB [Terriglobales bacterium]